ncbi:type 1 glutamine amidotransferase [Propionivibrio limicola]|uniref:type 1 glutamine amidotransferase n=1 Tax=Propionivibrio limicola TaxID=167645 RepID=UPI001292B28B|nr:type 1 glutamine amidotransferase [Propionivibrio limicola]
MKPVVIFRHTRTEGPGYFATFLEKHSIPWKLIAIDQGESVPACADEFSGLCLMGGTISVNDPLPWIDEMCALIRQAIAANIPVLGHCLGGQLISKALGGQVTKNPVKELGWGTATVENNEVAQHWLGDNIAPAGIATVFQWHGETFTIPPGASRILSGKHCANQMFVIGPHLGMQCHVEMTPEMISTWCNGWNNETRGLASLPPSVQTPDEMQSETTDRLPAMRRVADQLYGQWIKGLADTKR